MFLPLFPLRVSTGTRQAAWGVFFSLAAFGCLPGVCFPASAEEAKPAEKKPPSASADKEKSELPAPVPVTLATSDGIYLAATYYPSNKGKEAVPVVLLHMWKQDSKDFKDLAPYLQKQGYAVLAPDLRGHGESTRQTLDGREITLSAATLSPANFGRMVTQDFLAVRNFLWEKNNEGKLNLNKLCLVGEEMGASVALNAAAYDAQGYEYGFPYYGPTIQLGYFVKAVVLISPEQSFKGFSLRAALQQPYVANDLSVMILVGKEDAKAFNEASRINSLLERSRPRLPKELPKDENEKIKYWQTRSLFFIPLETKLQGSKLLDSPNLAVDRWIDTFIYYRIEKNEAARRWSWKELKLPHQ
jgi:pimeloyl-ACP methyl ester carboxylesterase